MKKIIILALSVCQLFLFTACGNADEDSSQDKAASNSDTVESTESTSELQLDSITITMDSNKLHEGVDFTDSELLEKTADFYNSVKESGKISEPESRETVYGGNWLSIKLSDGSSIYFESGIADYVRLGRDTYHIENDADKSYKQYVIDYLTGEGYWG